MAITKEEILQHQKDTAKNFTEKLIEQLELAMFNAASKQHNNLRHPFHPLIEGYLLELQKNGFQAERDGLEYIRISW
jgi:hypothetical protein